VYICMHMRKKWGDTKNNKKILIVVLLFFDLNKLKPDYKNTTMHNIIVRSETSEMNK
jgi:hypothetical protein